jgi:hypothetical protein
VTVRSKDLEGDQSRVTWYADITQGDVDPHLTCHVSPGFVCFADPIGPLTRDMCHPLKGPCVTPPWHVFAWFIGGWSSRGPPILTSAFNTSPRARRTLRESGTSGLQRFGV